MERTSNTRFSEMIATRMENYYVEKGSMIVQYTTTMYKSTRNIFNMFFKKNVT